MIYEIMNPSDPYTLETDDHEAAALACIVLGRGMYGLRCNDESKDVPILFNTANEWCKERFGCDCDGLFARIGKERLAAALDSVLIGNAGRRELMIEAMAAIDDPVKREAFRAAQHDKARSSLNDIGGRAYRLAKTLRTPAPPTT